MFVADTIKDWTPAQLQMFIQSVMQVTPDQIPTSLNFDSSQIATGQVDALKVRKQLDIAARTGLKMDNVPVGEAAIPTADANGQLVWQSMQDWERHSVVLGETWAGQNFDCTHAGDSDAPALVSQRIQMSFIEVKKTTSNTGFVVAISTADGGQTYTHGGYALYGPWLPGDTSVSLVKSSDTTTSHWSTTGVVTVDLGGGPIAKIAPGYYFIAVLANWGTGAAAHLFGTNARPIHAADSGSAHFSRSCGLNNQTGTWPSTISCTDANFAHYQNIFWVGALQA